MSDFERRLEAIRHALNAFEIVLTPGLPADLTTIGKQRVMLSRAVNDFLTNEWRNVNAPEDAGCDLFVRDRQRAIYKAFVDLRMRYSSHIAKWTSVALASGWTAYRRDCEQLISGMRNLLAMRAEAGLPV